MENSVSGFHIELTYAEEEELRSPQVLASKIYRITEDLQQEDGDLLSSYLCVPKEEFCSNNRFVINKPECGNEDLFVENKEQLFIEQEGRFFLGNEDDQDSKSSAEDSVEQEDSEQICQRANKTLLCPICGTEFSSFFEWNGHLNDTHAFNRPENLNMDYIGVDKAKCKECNYTVKSRKLKFLQQHKINHLLYRKYIKCKLCNDCFENESRYKHHLRDVHHRKDSQEGDDIDDNDSSSAVLLCPYCGFEFATSSEWRKHLRNIHDFYNRFNLNMEFLDNNRAKCKECQCEVSSKTTASLQQHKMTHLHYKRHVKCKLCLERSINHMTHKRHMIMMHSEKDSQDDGDYANSTARTYSILLCPFCGTDFHNTFEWRKHLKDTHELNKLENLNMELLGDNRAKCKDCQCEVSSESIWSLQHHKITHLPFHQYVKCKLCDDRFENGKAHKEHIEELHKVLTGQLLNDNHTNSCNETYTIQLCPFCGKEFTTSLEWRKHLKNIHGFFKRQNLNMEIITPFKAKCNDCEIEVSAASTWCFQRHRIRHLPYSRYIKCALCERQGYCELTHRRHLKVFHNIVLRRESRDKSFTFESQNIVVLICPFCGKEYHNMNGWLDHLNGVHEMSKRENLKMDFLADNKAQCKQCQLKICSKNSTNLHRHMMTHLPYNLYAKCNLCPQYFSRTELLTFHLRSKHNIKYSF